MCHKKEIVYNQYHRPAIPLPELGGTNPNPLAPTMTPLVSPPLSGGPIGNRTGPGKI